ncbi:hypothetical protein SAMN05444354_12248 [Stigmatella aurantiaca]|uniref:Outer membrane protein beta-barrel domain-containing protein n=1 Tax=Stigmatella aurantiaca TaxID=41 RepID=A0A1H8ATJ0_STIAU|nr:hypothetical protein [Stigmatella aurantiaca]SEM74062.1 hypothetical protein SAMN05444354_12248 [Stigmatella aurantiaca]
MHRRIALVWLVVCCLSATAHAQAAAPEPFFQVRAVGELGFLDVHSNTVRYGRTGSIFRFTEDGGQDNLLPFTRLSLELAWKGRHTAVFLYQPLEARGETVLGRDITFFEDVSFPAGTPLNVRYAFPFWRASYLYDFFAGQEYELSVGASLQLRNATTTFTSADGARRWSSRDVGPVPILKVRGRYTFGSGVWLGLEVDGIYASGGLLSRDNTADSFNASLLDASARAGMRVTPQVDVYLNLRYLGGGARGTDEAEAAQGPGDGYSSNWLNTATVSLGFLYRLPVGN